MELFVRVHFTRLFRYGNELEASCSFRLQKTTVMPWELLLKEPGHRRSHKLGLGYEMPCLPVDAMDPWKSAEAAYEAIERARREETRHLYWGQNQIRYRGHSMSDFRALQNQRRSCSVKLEEIRWDHVNIQIYWENNWAHCRTRPGSDWRKIKSIRRRMYEFMEQSPYPDASRVYDFVYSQENYPFLR